MELKEGKYHIWNIGKTIRLFKRISYRFWICMNMAIIYLLMMAMVWNKMERLVSSPSVVVACRWPFMVCRYNVEQIKCWTDKMSNRQNVEQAKFQTGKMSNRQNVKQTKCRTGKISNRQNVEQTKCRTDKMPSRQNAEQTKCRTGKMPNRKKKPN